MATYGAMIATATGGAQVAIERALGWSRQLALTPLHPAAYILIEVIVSMALGAVSVIVVFVLASLTGVHAPLGTLIASGLLVILTSGVFAAFGVMLGYLLPAENAIQVASMVLGILSLIGGLFVPLAIWPDTLQTIAPFTPAYGTMHGASPLPARETDVLRAAADGASVDEVGAQLYLSAGTVRNRLSSAIGKTNARNRADAARIASENGWL
nr:ABC transporter permease [Brevibacterium permense]